MKKDKTILVGGCFDFIHFGHITFLKRARSLGTYLIVALESDSNVRHAKGKQRPIHSQQQRKEMLESLSFVDEVIPLEPMHTDAEYFDLVRSIHPHSIAITQGDPIAEKKAKQAEVVGAQLVVIPKVHTPSTSQLSKLLGLE